MKQFITTIVAAGLLSLAGAGYAKDNNDLLKANYLYTRQAFGEAINYYSKVAPASSDPKVLANLGDCYRLTRQPAEAASWYAKAVTMPGCPENVKLSYAQVLMNTQEYDKAAAILKEYQKNAPEDRRIANMLASCNKAASMKNNVTGTVNLEPFNTDQSEFGPAMKDNKLYFTTDANINGMADQNKKVPHPFYTIYSVDCQSAGNCNGALGTLGGVNTKYHDGPCVFSPDGQTMYFTRTNFEKRFLTRSPIPDKNDVVHLQIMVATEYDENKKQFKRIDAFDFNDKNYSTAHPAISRNGNILVFASDMPGGEGGNDLYMCTKDAYGHWSKPFNLGKDINTEGDEMFPYIAEDHKLYYASDGLVGYGGLDIYELEWDINTNNFKKQPVNMGSPVNSSYDDMSLIR